MSSDVWLTAGYSSGPKRTPSEVMNDAPHDSHAPVRAKSQPQRVFDGVSGRIHAGALKPGDRVPSEPELMRELSLIHI